MKYKRSFFRLGLALTAMTLGSVLGHGSPAIAQSRPGAPLRSWYNCLTKEVWSLDKQAWCRKVSAMQNAEYDLPLGGPIKLAAGRYEDSLRRVNVVMLNQAGKITLGDLNRDNQLEGVAVLISNTGGSGNFTYLVVTQLSDGQAQQIGMTPLGDRVRIESVTVRAGLIILNLITHDVQDPACCPTKRERQVYKLVGQRLQRVNVSRGRS